MLYCIHEKSTEFEHGLGKNTVLEGQKAARTVVPSQSAWLEQTHSSAGGTLPAIKVKSPCAEMVAGHLTLNPVPPANKASQAL